MDVENVCVEGGSDHRIVNFKAKRKWVRLVHGGPLH